MSEPSANSFGLAALRSDGTARLAPLTRLRRLAALERDDLAVIVIYASAAGLVSLAVPIAAQNLVNTVAFTALLQPLVVLTVLVFLGLLVAGLMSTVQQTIIERLQRRVFIRTAHDVAGRLLDADVARLPGRKAADLTNRFFDVVIVQKAASTLLLDGLSSLLQATVAMLLLAFYHPALLAFALVLLACIAFVLFGLGRDGVDTAIEESKRKHQTGAWLEQLASAPLAFKGPRAAEFAFSRIDALARGYVNARAGHFEVLLRQIIASHVLRALATAALLGLGGALVIQQQLTLGQLVAAELAVTGVLASVAKSSKSLESYYDLTAALDKVGSLVDLPSERQGGVVARRRDGAARLSLVEVGVEAASGAHQLRRVSFSVSPGAWLAVIGDDSEGRATLVSLMYGVRTPATGRIELDGMDLRSISLEQLRAEVVLVSQASLYDGTVADNLHWGKPPSDPQRTLEILTLLELLEPIERLPTGLSTPISSSEHPFSEEQALRLTLARALLSEPSVLLLDGVLDMLGPALARRMASGLGAVCPDVAVVVFSRRADVAGLFENVERLARGVKDDSEVAA